MRLGGILAFIALLGVVLLLTTTGTTQVTLSNIQTFIFQLGNSKPTEITEINASTVGNVSKVEREGLERAYGYESLLGTEKVTGELFKSQPSCISQSPLVGDNWDFVEVTLPFRPKITTFAIVKPDGKVYKLHEGFNPFLKSENVTITNEAEALKIAELFAAMAGSGPFPDIVLLCDKSDIPSEDGTAPDVINPPMVERDVDTFRVTLYTWTWCGHVAKWEIPIVSKGVAKYPEFEVIEGQVGDYHFDYNRCGGYKGWSLKMYAGEIKN